jgi:hypothetical protein
MIRPNLYVLELVRRQTDQHFRSMAHRREEAVSYWAGVKCNETWIVTTLVIPRAHTTLGSFEVSASSNADVVSFLTTTGLKLIAQLHTHPGKSVGHSQGDDFGASLAHENFLSIVIPHFGARGIGLFKKCGVHRFENGSFRRLAPTEVGAVRWLPAEKTL